MRTADGVQGEGGSARLWDVATGHQVGKAMTPGPDSPYQTGPSWVTAVTFSPSGKTLATDTEFKAQLWNVATHHVIGTAMSAGDTAAYGWQAAGLCGCPPGRCTGCAGRPTVSRGLASRLGLRHDRRADSEQAVRSLDHAIAGAVTAGTWACGVHGCGLLLP